MKKLGKVLLVPVILVVIGGSTFASTYINQEIINDDLIRQYEVTEEQEKTFIDSIEKEFEINGEKYNFINYQTEGGNIQEEKQISTTKTITSKTNNIEKLVKELGDNIKYSENEYTGIYILDTESIGIKTINNGYYEKLIEENRSYSNLEKNDLDFISKTIEKDELILDLLNIEWQVQSTKKVGEYEVPDLYTANCYYATKIKVDYLNTYTVTANYNGIARKVIEKPITITVNYKKQEVPMQEKKEDNNIGIVASAGGAIIVFVLFLLLGNVTVYNMKDGRWKKVGKVRIRKSIVRLDRFELMESTNRYKLEFSKELTRKMQGKMITVKKGKNTLKHIVNTNNEKYIFETRI